MTYDNHGDIWTPTPRIPGSAMSEENQTIPRICAAPTIEGCLLALADDIQCGIYQHKRLPINVYVTDADEYDWMTPYYDVPDAHQTGEVWLRKPATFYRKYRFFLIMYQEAYNPEYYREKYPEPEYDPDAESFAY